MLYFTNPILPFRMGFDNCLYKDPTGATLVAAICAIRIRRGKPANPDRSGALLGEKTKALRSHNFFADTLYALEGH